MKFITLNAVIGNGKKPIHVNADQITFIKPSDKPGGTFTQIDFIGGGHVTVTESPTDILKLAQGQNERF